MNKSKLIFFSLISMLLFSPMAIPAETDNECTALWCTDIGWIDNLGDGKWWMERIDSAGNKIEASAKDRVEEMIKNAGLAYLQSFIPFLSIGGSGPSALDLAVERILGAINEAETNIIDAIVAESLVKNGISWAALKENTAYYFSFSEDAEKEALYYLLTSLLERSTLLRLEFQQNRINSNPNRDFDTYNYDAFHTYLNLVALETVIMIEHIRMTKIIGNPLVSDEEIQSQVYVDLSLLFNPYNPDSPFSYVSWLDSDWRNASDARFSDATFGNDADYTDITMYMDVLNYPELDLCQTPDAAGSWSYFYQLDGAEYKVSFKKWIVYLDPDRYTTAYLECSVVIDSFGDIIAFDIPEFVPFNGGYYTSKAGTAEWDLEKSKLAISAHQERDYPVFLKRGFGPARDILDDWWSLAGFVGSRPNLAVDNFLNNNDPDIDADNDGLVNSIEWEIFGYGNGHLTPDFDDDGIPDGFEYYTDNLNPNLFYDAMYDPDMDGFSNLQEYQGNSDPNNSDSTPETVKLAAILVPIISLILN